MRVLTVGKYPPLQGGVSAACYHAALEAVDAGHELAIVTNANLAGPTNRVGLTRPSKPDTPTVSIHQIKSIPEGSFIPWYRPDLSQLVGLGLLVARDLRAELVVGWYLEPYGMAASAIASLLGLPLCIIHAGSDVGRLAANEDLRSSYEAVMRSARFVLTTAAISDEFGLRRDHVVSPGWRPVVRPGRRTRLMRQNAFIRDLVADFNYQEFYKTCPPRLLDLIVRFSPSPELLARGTPIVAMFSKIHPAKGYFQLVAALNRVLESGLEVRLLVTLSGDERRVYDLLYAIHTEFPMLAGRTIALPILHPAIMPELLQICEIVCCLDHKFPIKPHQPRLVREALAAQTALICSRESVAKSGAFQQFAGDETCEIVENPDDVEALSEALEKLVVNPELRRRRQINAGAISSVIEAARPPEGPLLRLIRAVETDTNVRQRHASKRGATVSSDEGGTRPRAVS